MDIPLEGNIWVHLPFVLLVGAILFSHYRAKWSTLKDRNRERHSAASERPTPPTL